MIFNFGNICRHSDELIQRLEKAGLGYHVDAEKTTDRLGKFVYIVYVIDSLLNALFCY